ncbi:MAG: hypothetical protein LUC33_06235, partial [Prevotellaceae bacterium]|nr:hypothetical protein [Prevotellaceae bacterium]
MPRRAAVETAHGELRDIVISDSQLRDIIMPLVRDGYRAGYAACLKLYEPEGDEIRKTRITEFLKRNGLSRKDFLQLERDGYIRAYRKGEGEKSPLLYSRSDVLNAFHIHVWVNPADNTVATWKLRERLEVLGVDWQKSPKTQTREEMRKLEETRKRNNELSREWRKRKRLEDARKTVRQAELRERRKQKRLEQAQLLLQLREQALKPAIEERETPTSGGVETPTSGGVETPTSGSV